MKQFNDSITLDATDLILQENKKMSGKLISLFEVLLLNRLFSKPFKGLLVSTYFTLFTVQKLQLNTYRVNRGPLHPRLQLNTV